jgi:hypothetical protein
MELIVTTFRVTVKVLGDDTHLVPSKDPWLVTPVFVFPFLCQPNTMGKHFQWLSSGHPMGKGSGQSPFLLKHMETGQSPVLVQTVPTHAPQHPTGHM